ncbi:MAG: relaxase/mobilization nuclease domain-containing protein [Blastocatellia bacterium]
MRAVVAIKSTSDQGVARATRYISERDRNPEREGTGPRPLFSDKEDTLTYRGADRLLSGGRGTPDKADLIHIAVSFRQDDYERLGATEEERKDQLREVAREAMSEIRADLRAKEMHWVVGIHLNTDHPHIHILISKEVKDLVTGKSRRMGRIPKELLPYSEARADGISRPAEGRIGSHFVAALDHHTERARVPVERAIKLEHGHTETKELRRWIHDEVGARRAAKSWGTTEKTADDSQVRHDRFLLGEAVEISLGREYATLDYERALRHGETFRFRARDESTGAVRQISEYDVRRRADARGSRAADEQDLRTSVERQEMRQQVAGLDVAQHSATISELRKVRGRLLDKLEKDLGRANLEHTQAGARAQSVRQKYAAHGQEAPSPIIARDKLNDLQEQAISHGLADRAEMLEQLRVTLGVENGQPTRNDQEAARLRAQLFTAQTEFRARIERADRFDQARHLRRWEVGGERWSLTDLDRLIEWQTDQARVVGRYEYHLDPRARKAASHEAARLLAVRDDVVKRIDERRGELQKETEAARKLVEVLTRIHDSEAANHAREGRAMPEPEFTREELRRIEANVEVTRDAGLLRQLDGFERSSSERYSRSERVVAQERLGRAVAREILAEIAHSESIERLSSFNERGDVQPLVIESNDGHISVHRLKETRPHSVVERALRPFIEKPAARETRHAIEAASANSQARIVADYEKSFTYLEVAREIADNLRAEARQQGIDQAQLAPAFTPKERIDLEIYAERQTDQSQRTHYLSLARGEVAQATPLHDTPGSRFAQDHGNQFEHGGATDQSHAYDTSARSRGRAR